MHVIEQSKLVPHSFHFWPDVTGRCFRLECASRAGAFLSDVNGKENQAADIIWTVSSTALENQDRGLLQRPMVENVIVDSCRMRLTRFTWLIAECTRCTIARKVSAYRPIQYYQLHLNGKCLTDCRHGWLHFKIITIILVLCDFILYWC